MKPLKLYNTMSRSVELFKPTKDGEVRMYACGPTVYDYVHIGNFRTYINEDILRRVLELAGYNVTHVVNVTDVGHLKSDADTGEDKVEKASKESGMTARQIADKYEEAFWEEWAKLN
ncbi:MAG: class I tRNA ligase family protein, partial [Chitinophagaceae bacterium]